MCGGSSQELQSAVMENHHGKSLPAKRSWFAVWFSHASVSHKKIDKQLDWLCSYNGMPTRPLAKRFQTGCARLCQL